MVWLTGASTRAAEGDIAGVVNGPTGPEARVWVIAETDDLETHLIKIVVTNIDDGRFLLPELPNAGYRVWVVRWRIRGGFAAGADSCRPSVTLLTGAGTIGASCRSNQ